ncbi:MAG TPA: hypothetical protein VM409_02505, partial [Chloroflexia bacterium]|nr:hypothetical protein [Chloroflexia bacterium]
MEDAQEPFRKPLEFAKLMEGYEKPWYVAGGWAIDLYLGRVRREHKDIDFTAFREDQLLLQKHFEGYDLKKVVGEGQLEPWLPGERLESPDFQAFLQVGSDGYAEIEVLFADREGDDWLFRSNHDIRRPLSEIGLLSPQGVPYLSPDIVLLFKSKHVVMERNPLHDHFEEQQKNDEADFQAVYPTLD